jgi:membrane protein implicated in regulation of membrane protease activity
MHSARLAAGSYCKGDAGKLFPSRSPVGGRGVDPGREVQMGPFTVIGAAPGFWVVLDVVFGLVGLVTVAVAAVTAARQVWRAWRAPIITGADGLIDRLVKVRTADGLTGRVLLDGALWGVRSAGAPLVVGQLVRVRAVDGLELVVEPLGWNGTASDMVTMLRGRWRSA